MCIRVVLFFFFENIKRFFYIAFNLICNVSHTKNSVFCLRWSICCFCLCHIDSDYLERFVFAFEQRHKMQSPIKSVQPIKKNKVIELCEGNALHFLFPAIECNDSRNFQLYRLASHSIIDFLFLNRHNQQLPFVVVVVVVGVVVAHKNKSTTLSLTIWLIRSLLVWYSTGTWQAMLWFMKH